MVELVNHYIEHELPSKTRYARGVQVLYRRVDCFEMGRVLALRCSDSKCGILAERFDPFQRFEGQNPEHHVRTLLARATMGVL